MTTLTNIQPSAACPPDQCPVTYAVHEIKNKLDSIDTRQNANSERLTRIEENSNYMRKVIEGNGKPGLLGDVEALKKWMYQEQGLSRFRKWVIPIVISLVFGVTSAVWTVWTTANKVTEPQQQQQPAPVPPMHKKPHVRK